MSNHRRSARPRHLGPAALAGLLLASCGGGQAVQPPEKLNRFGRPLKPGTQVPAWVDRAPESTRARCVAVGFSKPTYWPQDALTNAAEAARGKLALALSSHVEAVGRLAQGGRGADAQLDLTKEATDLVMQNSRIEATWSDEAGVRDEPGTVWALAVLDLQGGAGQAAAGGDGEGGRKVASKMPGWLNRLPSQPGRIYAAGYSGPTYSAGDALQYAGDAAVQNLAASLRSHVQAYSLLITTRAGMSVEEFAHSDDPDKEFLELVRKSARVEQVWVDDQGARAGDPPGSVWALAGIDVGSQSGGYQRQASDALGPALDAQGNVPAGADDATGQGFQARSAARAQEVHAAMEQRSQAAKAAVDAHNQDVAAAVKEQQAEFRQEAAPAGSLAQPSAAPAAPVAPPAPAQLPRDGGEGQP